MSRIDAIIARLGRAVPGPWYQGQDEKRYESSTEVYSHADPYHPDSIGDIALAATPEQAHFIAHLHPDLTGLVAVAQGVRPRDEEWLDAVRDRLAGAQGSWDQGAGPGWTIVETDHGTIHLNRGHEANLIISAPGDIRFLLDLIDDEPVHICSGCAHEGGSTHWDIIHLEPEFLDMSARCWECDTRETGDYFEARLTA